MLFGFIVIALTHCVVVAETIRYGIMTTAIIVTYTKLVYCTELTYAPTRSRLILRNLDCAAYGSLATVSRANHWACQMLIYHHCLDRNEPGVVPTRTCIDTRSVPPNPQSEALRPRGPRLRRAVAL